MTDSIPPEEPHAGVVPDGERSTLSDGEWHRLHPLTPLFRGGLALVIVAGVIITNLRDRLFESVLPWFIPGLAGREFPDDPSDPVDYVVGHNLVPLAALAVLVVVLILIGLFAISWRFHTFRITEDDVEVRQGVFFRSHRRAPLDRVQGVDLTRPLLARLFGMAKLEVVGAGLDANVKLEYLSTANAEAVRSDILRLASGRQLAGHAIAQGRSTATAAVTAGLTGIIAGAEAPVEEPTSVVTLPTGRIIGSQLLSGTTIALLIVLGAIVVGSASASPWLLFSMFPVVIAFGAVWIRRLTRSLRYSIAPTHSGLRITFGLLTTVTETLPPGRIHAVEVSQPLLWRPAGWWMLRVNRLSGRGARDNSNDQFDTILPVGSRAEVERVLALLLPGLPAEDWPAVFDTGAVGPTNDDPFTNTPGRARLLRPVSWRRNGFLLTPDALFLRRGRIWRILEILPLARMQSISISQGPLDRSLSVAGIRAHTIAGRVPGKLGAIDRDAALQLFAATERAAIAAAAGDRSHRWAEES